MLVVPVSRLHQLAEGIVAHPLDVDLSLEDQGFDSLALLDLLDAVEDLGGFRWPPSAMEQVVPGISLADVYALYVRHAVDDAVS